MKLAVWVSMIVFVVVMGTSFGLPLYAGDELGVRFKERESARLLNSTIAASVGDGYFREALDATLLSVKTERALPEYGMAPGIPLTVELWCRVNPGSGYNGIIANESGESVTQWRIYSTPEGYPVLYVPGMEPSLIEPEKKSEHLIKLGGGGTRWRYFAMVWDGDSASLFLDGREILKQKLEPKGLAGKSIGGVLTIGQVIDGDDRIDCNGRIDEVRISRTARLIESGLKEDEVRRLGPSGQARWEVDKKYFQPFALDEDTVGLWRFDPGVDGARFLLDESKNANHLRPSAAGRFSKSELDRADYRAMAGPAPLDSAADVVRLSSGEIEISPLFPLYSLNGEWQMVQTDDLDIGHAGAWRDGIPAPVPGSVHTALYKSGIIADPYFGRNQETTEPWSRKTYFLKKDFPRPPAGQDETLLFEGICNRAAIWLNGEKLGDHEGMFIPVSYPVQTRLKDKNSLVVKLHPALNWRHTVVFNNSYGWHYAKFPPLGIWQPVHIHGEPEVKIEHPFIATRDAHGGTMDLVAEMSGPDQGWEGELIGVIEPDNFTGATHHFKKRIRASGSAHKEHLRFDIPDPQLWWPVDMGAPNLYRLRLAFMPDGGGRADSQELTFGIRTVEKLPVAGRKHSNVFDWTFVINGRPIFIKGAGWCTLDAMMDFSRERYERFIALAADQHVQMLRAWGSGMVETDDFYDLCNRYGVMVLQEWPAAWNSHEIQPYDMMKETVRAGILRLRNHPSLVLYGAGNESSLPVGKAIDMMGRLAVELDDTRDFHRGQPDGGSLHDYKFYWGRNHIDSTLQMKSIFWGEFGAASYPDYESVMRFMPDDEKSLWPVNTEMEGSFTYHTPTFDLPWFNRAGGLDWKCLSHAAGYFTEGATMQDFIRGTQVAQAVGVRHALERSRTRWPYSTGALYYKLNDNAPAASWATIDWYGAPKIGHYLIKHSFAPLVAVGVHDESHVYGSELNLPVFLLDDAGALGDKNWEVQVRAYGADLKPIKDMRVSGSGTIERVKLLSDFSLDAEQTKHAPLFFVLDVLVEGSLAQRNYNFINFETKKDCLFQLPKTSVTMQTRGENQITLTNTGNVPAVAVNIRRPGHQDTFTAADNYIWLEPGESKTIKVNVTQGLSLKGWNL
jgi:beta-mannosidase